MKAPLTLLYHAIADPPPGCDAEELRLFVTPRQFEWQMAALERRGYRSLRLDEYATQLRDEDPGRTVLITFDDAYAHVDEAVTPVLRRHGYSAVMFVPWAYVGQRNSWDSRHPRLTALEIAGPDQLREMLGVWELASHGLSHVDLRSLPSEWRRRELAAAREGLSEIAGRQVVELAYPFGCQDPGVRSDTAAAGYELAFTASGGGDGDPLRLPRRPIRSSDGRLAFRAKTEPAAVWLYRLAGART